MSHRLSISAVFVLFLSACIDDGARCRETFHAEIEAGLFSRLPLDSHVDFENMCAERPFSNYPAVSMLETVYGNCFDCLDETSDFFRSIVRAEVSEIDFCMGSIGVSMDERRAQLEASRLEVIRTSERLDECLNSTVFAERASLPYE